MSPWWLTILAGCAGDTCPEGSAKGSDGLCHLTSGEDGEQGGDAGPDDSGGGGDADTGATTYRALSVGGWTVCGIRATDAGVDCWLEGPGTLADFGQADAPAGTFAAVSAGTWHTCGLLTDGSVSCWGQPGDGDLGKLSTLSGTWDQVSAGLATSCARSAAGAVACVVDGADETELSSTSDAAQIDAGPRDTLVLSTDGTIRTWPEGDYDHPAPADGARWVTAKMGGTFACALDDLGAVDCWGDNFHGQTDPPTSAFQDVDAGVVHACALDEAGAPSCWGNDTFGQATPPAGPFTALSAGAGVTCGLDDAGAVSCWGGRSPTPPESDELLSHEAHIQPIWDAHCIHCHNGWESGRLNLVGDAGYGAMTGTTWRQLAEPGDPDGSVVLARIRATGESRMPPGYALDPALVTRITTWIQEGAAP